MIASCSKYREDLSALQDGELGADEQAELNQHLAACPPCAKAREQIISLTKILQVNNQAACAQAPDLLDGIKTKLPSVCQCVQDDLSAYLDGELLPPAKEGVAEHISQCSICLSKFNDLTRVHNLLVKGLQLPQSVNTDIWPSLKSRLNDDCPLIKDELSAFIDREVATLRHRTITAHLTECQHCSCDFNEMSRTGDLLREAYQPDIDERFDISARVMARIKVVPFQQSEKRRAPHTVRRLYVAAAAAALGIIAAASVGFGWFGHGSTPSVQPVTAEAYLIDQSLGDPADVAEAVVYDHTP